MPKVLLIYGSNKGQTHKIEDVMAARFRAKGWEPKVVDGQRLDSSMDLAGYDAIIVGASVYAGKHPEYIVDLVKNHRDVLESKPSAFFSVSLSAAGANDEQQADAKRCLDEFQEETGWYPPVTQTLAGALAYREYNWIMRWLMRRIAQREGGDTDTFRDHEYTDWRAVDGVVDRVIELAGGEN